MGIGRLMIAIAMLTGIPFRSALGQQHPLQLPDRENRLIYKDYIAEKTYDEVLRSWTVRLSRGNRLLAVFATDQTVSESYHIAMGLHQLLPVPDNQLAVLMSTSD